MRCTFLTWGFFRSLLVRYCGKSTKLCASLIFTITNRFEIVLNLFGVAMKQVMEWNRNEKDRWCGTQEGVATRGAPIIWSSNESMINKQELSQKKSRKYDQPNRQGRLRQLWYSYSKWCDDNGLSAKAKMFTPGHIKGIGKSYPRIAFVIIICVVSPGPGSAPLL